MITLAVAFAGKYLARVILGTDDITQYTNYIYIILATNLVIIFLNLSFAVLRSKERSKTFTFFSFVKFTLILILNVYFVVGLNLGIWGILLGNFIASTVLMLFFLPTLLKSIMFTFSRQLFRKLSIFGFAIIPASLAMWIMDLSDRYFLKYFTDFTEVGLYSLGYKIGFLVYILLVAPFQLAWPKVSFAIASRPDCQKIYAQTLTYFAFLGSLMALFLSLFGPQIIKLMADPRFFLAYTIIPLISFAYVLYGLHFIIVPGLHIKEKSKYYPVMIAIPAVLNLLLNYYFVPKFGMMGAAITTLICFILVVILTYIITQRFYRVKYEGQRLFKLLVAVLLILAINYIYPLTDLSLAALLYHLALLGLFLLIILLSRFFTKDEIQKIKSKLPL